MTIRFRAASAFEVPLSDRHFIERAKEQVRAGSQSYWAPAAPFASSAVRLVPGGTIRFVPPRWRNGR